MNASTKTLSIDGIDPHLATMLQQEMDLGARALQQGNPDMAITFFRSALTKITTDFPFYDHINHNLLLAIKNRAEQLLKSGRKAEALELLEHGLAIDIEGPMIADRPFRRAFADTVHAMGLVFFENTEIASSLECIRRAIAIEPNPLYHVDVTNALSILKQPAVLSDFTEDITPKQLGRHVFIACVPKSASTFLKNVLTDLTQYRDVFSVYSAWQTDQEIYLPTIVEYADQNTVTQQHCRASESNIQIMQAFNIRPVILVRNVFDAVVSMVDFYRQGASFNSYHRADFPNLSEEKQVDLIIDFIVPWYLQFVASWKLAEQENRVETYWLTYEELTQNKTDSIKNLLEFYGLGAHGGSVERLVAANEAESRRNRFNKGVAGRGKSSLTDAQKQRIIALTEYYPATDFRSIGLDY